MQQHLIITLLADNNAFLIQKLSECCSESQCDILDAHFTRMGNHLSGSLLASGSWMAVEKLERLIQSFRKTHDAELQLLDTKRSAAPDALAPTLPYQFQVLGVHRPQILTVLIDFFLTEELQLSTLAATHYTAPHTQTVMSCLQGVVLVPVDFHLARLREAFIIFCDSYNLEVMFEPMRN